MSLLRREECAGRNSARPQMRHFAVTIVGKFFSVRTGTVMQRSKIGYQSWLIATASGVVKRYRQGQHEAGPRIRNYAEVSVATCLSIRAAWAAKQESDLTGG